MRGVIKGLGLQSEIIWVHIIFQGLVNTVLIWVLAFHFEMGLAGIWFSKIISDSFITLYYFMVVGRADWDHIANVALKRQANFTSKKEEKALQ
mmetsp:Transcript_30008/g.45880  ORF Transcript_30008/g.45880 Transcript_30008/m.45880 type:complete len:93 (+) Transcript_30008:1564-1842(+)